MSGATARWVDGARTALKRAAMAADAVVSTDGVVVLAYHRIDGAGGSQMNLAPQQFRRQLNALMEMARVVTLDAALAELAGAVPPPVSAGDDRPAVVLTFDDGTADFVTEALPVLDDLGLPATLYLATGPVESNAAWPDGASPLTWAQLGELATSTLVTIGCHTHDHLLLDRADPRVVADDLDRSINLIGEHCGSSPTHFAYPKALAPSEANEALVRERFVSAALAGTRPNRIGRSDPHRLTRSPIQRADTPRNVAHKMAGGMRLEDDVRRLVHRAAYRGAKE